MTKLGKKRKAIKIFYDNLPDSVVIDGDVDDEKKLFYSSLKDFYTTGHGHGLQCGEDEETEKYKRIMKLCDSISDLIYKLSEEL